MHKKLTLLVILMSKNFKDGELDGLFESYDENGQLSFSLNYKDGKMID